MVDPHGRRHIAPGKWKEKLTIAKPFVHLIGEDRKKSLVAFDAAAGHKTESGEPYGTRGCATLIVQAQNFAARNLTIANRFDYVANLMKTESDPARLNDPQGVALMLDQGADLPRRVRARCHVDGQPWTRWVLRRGPGMQNCAFPGRVPVPVPADRDLAINLSLRIES